MPDNIAMDDRDEALFAQQQVARLQALLEASRQIHSTIVLDDVLNTVLKIVVRELELDGAFFKHFLNSYGDVPQTFSVPDRDAVGHEIRCTGEARGRLSRHGALEFRQRHPERPLVVLHLYHDGWRYAPSDGGWHARAARSVGAQGIRDHR